MVLLQCCSLSFVVVVFLLRTFLGSWSASTSPARSPSPNRFGVHSSAQHRSSKDRSKNHLVHQPYDTTILCERSRSPSPAQLLQELRDRDQARRKYRNGMGTAIAKY
uniref:Secreted protein n=1 Tax=Anopheles maculatus TaxID=74869 RepID=A0A182SFP1_9DIPT